MLYIAKDRSAVMLEDGVYLHVFNPRLTKAPEGSISVRPLGKNTDVLDYTFRDGSSLSISVERDRTVGVDLVFSRGTLIASISYTVSQTQYTLPVDPVVHVLNARDRVVVPLLLGDVDALDTSFFDAPFFATALIAFDPVKNLIFIDAPGVSPSISLRETGKNKDMLDLLGKVVETLEQAGVKVVFAEM